VHERNVSGTTQFSVHGGIVTRIDSNPYLIAVFDRQSQADRAVERLRQAGFRDDQIGLAIRTCEPELLDLVADRAARRSEEGLAGGAVVGGVLGAAVATLVPGLGEVLAWGILTLMLEGASLGAAAGGLIGGLTGLGVSQADAHYCNQEFEGGHPIVLVTANGERAQALQILQELGGRIRP